MHDPLTRRTIDVAYIASAYVCLFSLLSFCFKQARPWCIVSWKQKSPRSTRRYCCCLQLIITLRFPSPRIPPARRQRHYLIHFARYWPLDEIPIRTLCIDFIRPSQIRFMSMSSWFVAVHFAFLFRASIMFVLCTCISTIIFLFATDVQKATEVKCFSNMQLWTDR